jgi:hypothetical protein
MGGLKSRLEARAKARAASRAKNEAELWALAGLEVPVRTERETPEVPAQPERHADGGGMRMFCLTLAVCCAALSTASFAYQEEYQKDHPIVARYPGSYPVGGSGRHREFDQFTLVLGKVKGDEQAEKTQPLEGRVYTVLYNNPEGRSVLEIFRNYEQGLSRAGFKALYSCTDRDCGARGQFERDPLEFHNPDYQRGVTWLRSSAGLKERCTSPCWFSSNTVTCRATPSSR